MCVCVLGVLCADWTALMPQSIKALKGSCVRIPCSFTLGSLESVDYNPCLKTHSCNAIWMRGGTDKTNTVGSSPSGNLNQKDCTTILDNMPTGDTYYLRLECGNCVKFNFGTPVQVNIAGRTHSYPIKRNYWPHMILYTLPRQNYMKLS